MSALRLCEGTQPHLRGRQHRHEGRSARPRARRIRARRALGGVSRARAKARGPKLAGLCVAGGWPAGHSHGGKGEVSAMKRLAMTIGAAALAFATGAPSAWAQQRNLADAQITTKDLGQGAYMLLGPGGNITIVTASDGILMVDAEFPPVHD